MKGTYILPRKGERCRMEKGKEKEGRGRERRAEDHLNFL